MVVQHNLTAMNSNRMLGLTTASQAKSTEKLSSGYKINRAADDAAGLSISEKMRKQIRGLTQASANAQDGISAVQTAEGALTEVHDMLQRMNELAVKAANETNSVDDRQNIQDEIDQLVTEIDRVAETTKFNEIYLLKGNKQEDKVQQLEYVTTPGTSKGAPTFSKGANNLTGGTTPDFTLGASAASKLAAATADVVFTTLDGTNYTLTGGLTGSTADISADYGITITGSPEGGSFTVSFAAGAPAVPESTAALYDENGNKVSANGLSSYFDVDGTTITAKADKPLYTDKEATVKLDDFTNYVKLEDTASAIAILDVKLHVGADATANNQIAMNIDAMDATSLGIKDGTKNVAVTGRTGANALDAIETIKAAILTVSKQRSSLGAVQNRLEHTINNLDNVVENTTAAESQIRDTDMAKEMVKYSNNNILAQAGQSMLAQANQTNQGVLSLLQ